MIYISRQIIWTKLILNTFLEESGINDRIELGDEKAKILSQIMRTRCAGYSIVKQAQEFNISIDTVSKYIRELKDLYDETQKNSIILPPRRKDPYEIDKTK